MNVLLIGGPGSLTNHMIVKLKKEGHRVSLLTGESYARKGYEKYLRRIHLHMTVTALKKYLRVCVRTAFCLWEHTIRILTGMKAKERQFALFLLS